MGTSILEWRYHTELIDGIEREKPRPKWLHALLQRRILLALIEWEKQLGGYAVNEIDVRCGADRLTPDVAFTVDAKRNNGVVIEGTLLAVEIISPGQTVGELFDKCERLDKGGVPYCWVIHPQKRMAWEYHASDGIFHEATEVLKAGDIRVFTEPLFRDLPDE